MDRIGVGIIGTGAITLTNHLPGLALCPQARVVALCDSNPANLERASRQVEGAVIFNTSQELVRDDRVHAILIATPNQSHPAVAVDAISRGKHVLCEKPLALDFQSALIMYRTACDASVRHMTAFTYRFVPAMRYMKHQIDRGDIGRPFHFRAQRFQDWGERPMGWRQQKSLAGSGELGDMLSHRLDYAHHLVGPIRRVVATMKTFIPTRGGAPSDVDDSVAVLAEFDNNVTGVLESTKLATGRGEGHRGQDVVEVNGSEGTIVYSTQRPLELQIGHKGDGDLHTIPVPKEFLVWTGSRRDPSVGDPLVTFRYDQDVEFIDAILNNRDATPSFREGAMAQAVMDAIIKSSAGRTWVEVEEVMP